MKTVKLSDVCDISSGETPSRNNPEFFKGDIPWAKISDIEAADNGFIYTTDECITAAGLKNIRGKLFPKGTLLFAMYGSIGKVAFAGTELSANQAILGIRPKTDDQIDLKYLKCWFESNKQRLINQGQGVALKNLSATIVRNLGIELPPLDDQKRIAHLLGKVEGLIARRKQHLQQLDDLLKSVFLEMFGDPVRNEKGLDKPDFETIISGMRNGLSPSKAGGYKGRVYTLSSITGGFFQEIFKEDTFSQIHDKYFPTDRDFLVCRGNGNINLVGKGYFFPGTSEGVIFPDTIIAVSIRANTVNKHFLEALWKTKFIRQQIENNARTTNGAHKINQGVIEKIKIIQPPPDLQNQFAAIVEKVEGLNSRYQQSLIII